MATNQGDNILASDVNSLFVQLNNLRIKHKEGAGQTSAAITALTPEFNTEPVHRGEHLAPKETEDDSGVFDLMKTYLNTLRQSKFITSITDEQINAIVTPDASTLIKFTEFNLGNNLIETMEQLPYEDSGNFSCFGHQSSNFNCFGHQSGNFNCFSFCGYWYPSNPTGNFSCFGHQSGNFSCFGHQSGNFSCFGHQSGNFSFFSCFGHRSSNFSCFGHQSGNFSCFSNRATPFSNQRFDGRFFSN